MKKRSKTTIILVLIFITLTQTFCFAAEKQVFVEMDEKIDGFEYLSETKNLGCILPYRDSSNNSPSSFKMISPYNEPRPSSLYNTHRGLDMNPSTGVSDTLYPVHKNGKYVGGMSEDASYGNFCTIQYKHEENNKAYEFQSFYAHMDSTVSFSKNADILINQKVGVTGVSGGQYNKHLHLEFREPAKIGATTGYYLTTEKRKYPPVSFFNNYTNNLNTAFISRTFADQNTVKFRVALEYTNSANNALINADNIIFHYSADNKAWTSTKVIKENNTTFYVNIGGLYTTSLKYYIEVNAQVWPGETNISVYRPYRYISAPPTDRPFVARKGITPELYSFNTTEYCNIIEEDTNSNLYSETDYINEKNIAEKLVWGKIISVTDDQDINFIVEDNDGNTYNLRIVEDKRNDITIKEGMNIRTVCNFIDDIYETDARDCFVY